MIGFGTDKIPKANSIKSARKGYFQQIIGVKSISTYKLKSLLKSRIMAANLKMKIST